MNKDNIQSLAKSLMFDITDKEVIIVNKKFDLFLKQVDEINLIDTTDIETLDYPFELANGELREDEFGEVLKVEEVLSNTENTRDNMVKIPKVVL